MFYLKKFELRHLRHLAEHIVLRKKKESMNVRETCSDICEFLTCPNFSFHMKDMKAVANGMTVCVSFTKLQMDPK